MKHIKLKNGFEFDAEPDELKKWGFVAIMRNAEDNPIYVIDLVKVIVGADNVNGFLKAISPDGNPLFDSVKDALVEAMALISAEDKEIKNS